MTDFSIVKEGLEPYQLLILAVLIFAGTLMNLYMLHMFINILRALWTTRFFTDDHPEGGLIKPGEEPVVTIQICVYNEASVIEKTIDAACQVDWPKNKLFVQVLDDSSDQTSDIIENIAAGWRERGVNCCRLTRPNRIGYKAGNLQAHSRDVNGGFVALFDADHRCDPQYLRKAIPHFFDKEGTSQLNIGLVATPWAYYNQHQNLLTEYDTLVLDYVFGVDRVGLAGAQNFFGFNGTGGIWRQAAIDAAGGWKWDTVTEDLDTSFLAHMKGYQFVYLRHIPQQLESTGNILAHRKQKHRWTKGRWQIARKRLVDFCKSPDLVFKVKLEAVFHLTVSMTYLIALISAVLSPVIASYGGFTLGLLLYLKGFNSSVFILGIVTATFGKVSANGNYKSFQSRFFRVLVMTPVEMSFSMGMAVFETAAMIDGLLSDDATFHRTAKQGDRRSSQYKNEADSIVVSENDDNEEATDIKKKKKKSYENENLEAILGILFVVYDCTWIAINVRSEVVTRDPIAIFMGIVVPLMASIGLSYMHGMFIYELVLSYLEKQKQQANAFKKGRGSKGSSHMTITGETEHGTEYNGESRHGSEEFNLEEN